MFRYLMILGLTLFLPGLYALGYSVYQGPSAWMVDSQTFWGTPISLFVFWIGLAHAGTLLSAIFLALDIKLDRRTALIAELSTLVSLVFAGIFPLMHLGVIDNFYMVAPFLDARGNFANVRSPLVWDFCCIAVYALLSLLFFGVHLKSREIPALDKYRKPLAWLLFPLVLWVHTVVSLDFATTFVPEWRGAFFPVYFIAGAILSGLALVNLLICAEGYRVRLLERLQLICTWILCAIWIWDLILKGYFCTSAFIFAGVLPQLRMVSVIREHRLGRIFFSVSILVCLFLERYYLVSPTAASATFGRIDLGLVAFSVGGFMLLFFGIRRYLNRKMEGAGSYFGEVDGTDLAEAEQEEFEKENFTGVRGIQKLRKGFYMQPWSSEEYRILRFPLLVGFAAAVLFSVWVWGQSVFANVDLSIANVIPLLYPIVAVVTAFTLCVRAYFVEKSFDMTRREKNLCVVLLVLAAACLGTFFAGGSSEKSSNVLDSQPIGVDTPVSQNHARLLWNARCATCHGVDGCLNEKFVREFYPVPQKLSVQRIDSLGVDSLVKVILNGRNNMNAYAGRLTSEEALGLVNYMRVLAETLAENAVPESVKEDQ
jgi:hypothetical protein